MRVFSRNAFWAAVCGGFCLLGCGDESAQATPGATAGQGASGGAGPAGAGGGAQAGAGGGAQPGAGGGPAGAGSGGAGGDAGAGGEQPGPVTFPELSDAARRVLEQAQLARQGQPADFDGDGKADYTVTKDESGAVTAQSDRDEDGMPEFVHRWDPSTSSGTMAFDPDQDGVNNGEITLTSGPRQRVIVIDDDLDGVFERRVTETYSADELTIHFLSELLDAEGNATKETEVDIPAAKYGGECSQGLGIGEFPADAPETPVPGSSGHVVVRTSGTSSDGGKGECSNGHTYLIAQAFYDAITDGLNCLSNTNDQAADLLKNALATGLLDISCGNSCNPATTAGSNGTAPLGGEDVQQRTRMSFDPKDLDSKPREANASKVLHELLHWAGMPDSGDKHDSGKDQVYACARYCGGCVSGQFYSPQGTTKNTDCAQCSDTKERRGQCGLKTAQKVVKDNYAICHGGLGCIAADCAEPVEETIKDCSGRTVGLAAWCCKSCPSDCNGSNDLPCQPTMPPSDVCTGETPFCK